MKKFCVQLLLLVSVVILSTTSAFAECNIDCRDLQGYSPFHNAVNIRGGPFNTLCTCHCGVIGATGDMSGTLSAKYTIENLDGTNFRITLEGLPSLTGKALTQCHPFGSNVGINNEVYARSTPIRVSGSLQNVPNNPALISWVAGNSEDRTYEIIKQTPDDIQIEHFMSVSNIELQGASVLRSTYETKSEFITLSSSMPPVTTGSTGTPPEPENETPLRDPTSDNGADSTPSTGCKREGVDFGDPCNIYTGDYWHDEMDMELPAIIPIRTIRSYYSRLNNMTGEFGVGSYLRGYNYILEYPDTIEVDAELNFNSGSGLPIVFTSPDGTNTFINNSAFGTTGDKIEVSTNGSNVAGAVYTNLEQDKLHFDANGFLTKTEDRYGNSLVMTRDNDGKLLTVTEPSTNKGVQIAYNADGTINQITDHANRTVSYGYDSESRLIAFTNAEGNTMSYDWNTDNRIIGKTDYNGNTTGYEYNTDGLVVKQTNPDGGELIFDYVDQFTRRATDPEGNTETITFNEQGYPIRMEDPLGNVNTVTYSPNMFTGDTSNRFVIYTDPLNRSTRYDLNENNLPVKITDPIGQQVTIVYDSVHQDKIISVTNPLGQTTQNEYDSVGNLVKIIDNDGKESLITYNNNGQAITFTNTLGNTIHFSYNAQNEVVSITDSLGNTTNYQYDDLSRVIQTIDPRGSNAYVTYDVMDRVTSITRDWVKPNSIPTGNTAHSITDNQTNSNSTNGSENPFTYTAREDDSNGLYHYRNRYYDPNLEVFISQDPFGDKQRYVSGNPIKFIDPLGLFKLPADPSGLPEGWELDPNHQNPSGPRYVNPNGDTLDFHEGQDGETGDKGEDHWHWNKNKRGYKTRPKKDKHLKPGEECPSSEEGETEGNEELPPQLQGPIVPLLTPTFFPIPVGAPGFIPILVPGV